MLAVSQSIAEHMTDYRVVVDKSTVPVGTADRVRDRIQQSLDAAGKQLEFDVVSNPEFLKEGDPAFDRWRAYRITSYNVCYTKLLR